MTRKYPQSDVKILYGKAGGRCSMPCCRINIILNAESEDGIKQIGEIGHIISHSPSGPRSSTEYPKDKLDSYENWILLCPTCHKKIDVQESKYSVDALKTIKEEHEMWMREILDENMSEVTFTELEVIAKAIASGQNFINGNFYIISPEQKIEKNYLTQEIRVLISTGLSRSNEVGNYLTKMAQLDSDFPERLKNGFKEKYLKFKETSSGDALFWDMFKFAKNKKNDFKLEAASLAILVYLFEICEIFEK